MISAVSRPVFDACQRIAQKFGKQFVGTSKTYVGPGCPRSGLQTRPREIGSTRSDPIPGQEKRRLGELETRRVREFSLSSSLLVSLSRSWLHFNGPKRLSGLSGD